MPAALERLLQDLRQVVRSSCRRPAVPPAAVLCFALGRVTMENEHER